MPTSGPLLPKLQYMKRLFESSRHLTMSKNNLAGPCGCVRQNFFASGLPMLAENTISKYGH